MNYFWFLSRHFCSTPKICINFCTDTFCKCLSIMSEWEFAFLTWVWVRIGQIFSNCYGSTNRVWNEQESVVNICRWYNWNEILKLKGYNYYNFSIFEPVQSVFSVLQSTMAMVTLCIAGLLSLPARSSHIWEKSSQRGHLSIKIANQ